MKKILSILITFFLIGCASQIKQTPQQIAMERNILEQECSDNHHRSTEIGFLESVTIEKYKRQERLNRYRQSEEFLKTHKQKTADCVNQRISLAEGRRQLENKDRSKDFWNTFFAVGLGANTAAASVHQPEPIGTIYNPMYSSGPAENSFREIGK